MKCLYLDCGMGAAGDMLAAALLELLPEQDAFLQEFRALKLPNVRIEREKSVKCGITGTHLSVLIDGEEESEDMHGYHHHHHHSLNDIEEFVAAIGLPERVRRDVMAVYGLIAEAESEVHGVSVEEVHFHEVGMMDAIADISLVCLLMERIGADKIIASPVRVGGGMVKCAHGLLPVPAPATARILRDIPTYAGDIKSELCTPTGAALLRHFVSQFCEMPVMRVKSIGYGMGKKDFPAANCVRAMLGETESGSGDEVLELRCNIDDMTAEEIGFALEEIMSAGALDVWTMPIGMKKCRPGTMLCMLCRAEDREKTVNGIFRYTSTLGIRESVCRRYTLERSVEKVSTEYGEVRIKSAEGYGVYRQKAEYEDIARIARERGCGVAEVKKAIEKTVK